MGAHGTGRKVWALGRWHRLNQALEALFVAALIAAATYAGWVSFHPASAPLGSVLNQPHVTAVPSRPADPPVPPVPVDRLSRGISTPAPAPRKRPSTPQKGVDTTNQGAARTPPS